MLGCARYERRGVHAIKWVVVIAGGECQCGLVVFSCRVGMLVLLLGCSLSRLLARLLAYSLTHLFLILIVMLFTTYACNNQMCIPINDLTDDVVGQIRC